MSTDNAENFTGSHFWGGEDTSGLTPLHCAAYAGHLELCKVLLRKRVALNARTNLNRTPLVLAGQKNHNEIAALFIKKGADITVDDLEAANVELCELLLSTLKKRYNDIPIVERGVREEAKSIAGLLNEADHNDRTLLHREAEQGNFEKCACLLDYFAPLTAVDRDGRTALHLACQAGENGDNLRLQKFLRTIEVLLADDDVDSLFVNTQDKDGNTALHFACRGGNAARVAVSTLLANNANPDLSSYGLFAGTTPRNIAKSMNYEELTKLFNEYPKK